MRKGIISFMFATLLFSLLVFYVRRPVTVAMVADKLPNNSPWKREIKEIQVDNLHNKMGLQLFQLQTEYSDVFFLVNQFQATEPLYSYGKNGDFYCMDYDGNGRWEFIYLSKDGMRSLNIPQLYVYGLQAGKLYLEKVYSLEGAGNIVNELALSLQNDGSLYINYDEKHPENNMRIQVDKGKLHCYGEKTKQIKVIDHTEAYRKRKTLQLSDLK